MELDEYDSSRKSRFRAFVDQLESIYLRILRISILVLATLILIGAAIYGVVSIYKVSRSEASVVERVAAVTPAELAALEVSRQPRNSDGSQNKANDPQISQRRYYADFVGRYHRLFAQRFEPFRQSEDKQLSKAEFGDAFVSPEERLEAIRAGDLDFRKDKEDLEAMLAAMTSAVEDKRIHEALQRYKAAKKVRVCRNVQRTRSERRSGWDSYSSNCSYWYESPIGCPVTRTVQVPYTANECTMEYPPGTVSHTNLLRQLQDRYFKLLYERRDEYAFDAEMQRAEIASDNREGSVGLVLTLQVLGAFLVLMFFFLLIAMERHQRSIARRLLEVESK